MGMANRSDEWDGDQAELLSHQQWVLRLARGIVGNGARAEDLAQDALLAAWAHPSGTISNLRAWLRQVVRTQALAGVRSDTRRASRESRVARRDWAEANADLSERAESHRRLVRDGGDDAWMRILTPVLTRSGRQVESNILALMSIKALWAVGSAAVLLIALMLSTTRGLEPPPMLDQGWPIGRVELDEESDSADSALLHSAPPARLGSGRATG